MRLVTPTTSLGLVLATVALILTACAPASLPDIKPLPDAAWAGQCRAIFPQGQWQFVHSIDFTMANGHGSTLLGVTSLDDQKLSCALLTPEGLTLFAAQFSPTQGINVTRAIPPFTNKSFAKELLADVRTIFLAPNEKNGQYGRLASGHNICRWQNDQGETIDLLPRFPNKICWQQKSYNTDHKLTRTIIASQCHLDHGLLIPTDLKLHRPGRRGYTLQMHLLRAENYN